MAVNLDAPDKLLPVSGIELSAVSSGIYPRDRLDLALMVFPTNTSTACVFTKNSFAAAPVIKAKQHLAITSPGFILVNSGNANAGTGDEGLKAAESCCSQLAELFGAKMEQVLPFSTGVIGESLPVEKISNAMDSLRLGLKSDGWLGFARAIMTTDTLPKGSSRQFSIGDRTVTITGVAKGAGMIRPDMATMLAFIATDAEIPGAVLQTLLEDATAASFNRICIDGDTSTNDAVALMATGQCGVVIDDTDSEVMSLLRDELYSLMQELAQAIVRDGEGATKFVRVQVTGASSELQCRDIAYDIATSPLVKTALFAEDPNWGRIIAAVGRSRGDELDTRKITLLINELEVFTEGGLAPGYREEKGGEEMQKDEISIKVDLGQGAFEHTLWTTDLSHEYVRINAEYRS